MMTVADTNTHCVLGEQQENKYVNSFMHPAERILHFTEEKRMLEKIKAVPLKFYDVIAATQQMWTSPSRPGPTAVLTKPEVCELLTQTKPVDVWPVCLCPRTLLTGLRSVCTRWPQTWGDLRGVRRRTTLTSFSLDFWKQWILSCLGVNKDSRAYKDESDL